MRLRSRLGLGLALLSVAAVPVTASAATTPAATTPAPAADVAPKPVVAWNHALVYLNRAQTYQVGNGGAWAVAGAVGIALAPATAGVGTVAAIGVGLVLGSVGSKVVNDKLAVGQCLDVNVFWVGGNTTVGWYPCAAGTGAPAKTS
ncbi:MAG: hypothetical protein AAGC46_10510 [Solirubrobacteraceae bacterium]|nr:hypothetical protein [Patulibacter sp.]